VARCTVGGAAALLAGPVAAFLPARAIPGDTALLAGPAAILFSRWAHTAAAGAHTSRGTGHAGAITVGLAHGAAPSTGAVPRATVGVVATGASGANLAAAAAAGLPQWADGATCSTVVGIALGVGAGPLAQGQAEGAGARATLAGLTTGTDDAAAATVVGIGLRIDTGAVGTLHRESGGGRRTAACSRSPDRSG
jgi:hypothetical protein